MDHTAGLVAGLAGSPDRGARACLPLGAGEKNQPCGRGCRDGEEQILRPELER